MPSTALLIVGALPIVFILHGLLRRAPRPSIISVHVERVLILGGTSGVGRSIAHLYARRGARVCVVGRRKTLLDEVVGECAARGGGDGVMCAVADFTCVDDMLRVRGMLEDDWQGVDTVIVVAGVSALQPLMVTAGVHQPAKGQQWSQATRQGIQQSVDVAAAATKRNYTGPFIAAVTFIPLLINTSLSPSILLFSSVASVIPAPTRSLYASTKAASLLLYQALSIEHPSIAFTVMLPGTMEGEFRASAVDGAFGSVREDDPNKVGLKREVVARRAVRAVDWQEKTVWMPGMYRWAHALYWIWPRLVEWRASVKYHFTP